MPSVFGRDASVSGALLANQFKTFLGAEDERRRGEDSSHHAIGSDHADSLATVAHRQARSRIEDVAIAAVADGERPEVIAGGGDRVIGQSHGRPAFARAV